jgi:uncharacterized membrane protein
MYVIILRLLHIVGGVIWAGSGLFQVFVLQPTVRQQGASGGAFMKSLMSNPRMGQLMGGSAIATLGSGILLYWHDFGAFVPSNGPMWGYAVGGLAAIVLWLVTLAVMIPMGRRMGALAERGAGGEDVEAEINTITRRQRSFGLLATYLMVAAVVLMAVARYL